MTKKSTKNQQAFKKEVQRIRRFIRNAEKRGFRFDYDIPEIPQRVTKKQLENIRRVKPVNLYTKATYLNEETGEIVTGYQGRQIERKRAGHKGYQTRQSKSNPSPTLTPSPAPDRAKIVLENLQAFIARFQPKNSWRAGFIALKTKDKNILQNIVDGAIKRDGKEVVAKRVEVHADEIMRLAENIMYGSSGKLKDQIQDDLSMIAWLINGGNLSLEDNDDLLDVEDEYEL